MPPAGREGGLQAEALQEGQVPGVPDGRGEQDKVTTAHGRVRATTVPHSPDGPSGACSVKTLSQRREEHQDGGSRCFMVYQRSPTRHLTVPVRWAQLGSQQRPEGHSTGGLESHVPELESRLGLSLAM